MSTPQPSRPVITPTMREQATKQPNSWLYVVDPIFTDPSAEIPPWGFIGGYRVDERGELTDDFSPNPNYRPSPVALRLPAPNNDAERALQLTTTGYAQGQTLLNALLDAELILFAQPQGSGLFTLEHESGRRQLQVFTSDTYLPPNWTTWQRMSGRQLAAKNPAGLDLQINPTSPVKARIPGEDLVKAAGSIPPQVPAGPQTVPPSNGTPVPPSAAAPPGPAQPASSTPVPSSQPAPQSASPTTTEKVAPLSEPAESDFDKRFIGSLLAGAIGDALGAAIEFYPVDQIRSRYGAQGITDYDRSGERPGSFTDDTQMVLFTLEGLIRGHLACRNGRAENPLASVQLAYQRWLHTQGYAWSRAAGPFAERAPSPNGWLIEQQDLFAVRSPNSDCITALREFASAGVPGTFDHAINSSQDCGGVVRAAPIALWSEDPKTVFELAAATAALTYSDPSGYLPAGVLATIVHRLLRNESLPEAVRLSRSLLVDYAGHEETDRLLQAAQDLAQQGKPAPEDLKDRLGSGWKAPEALAIAVCAALSTEGIASAVIVAVNHSGDSDSTGSLCGNIVGAQYGSDSLPGVWLRDLKLREVVETLAKDGLVEFGASPPNNETWSQRYPTEGDVSDIVFASTVPPVGSAPATTSSAKPAEPEAHRTKTDRERDTVVRVLPHVGEQTAGGQEAAGTAAPAPETTDAAVATESVADSGSAETPGGEGSGAVEEITGTASAAMSGETDSTPENEAVPVHESEGAPGADAAIAPDAVSQVELEAPADRPEAVDQVDSNGETEAGDQTQAGGEAETEPGDQSKAGDQTEAGDQSETSDEAEIEPGDEIETGAALAAAAAPAGADAENGSSGDDAEQEAGTAAVDATAVATDAAPAHDRSARVAGFLLGGAIGDALGYPIEDASLQEIRERYGAAGVTDLVDAHRPAGAISDGTQMMMFTTEGLVRAATRRRLHAESEPVRHVQHAYQRWLHTQGFEWKDAGGPIAGNPPDGWLIRQKELFARRAPGATCVQALHGYAGGKPLSSLENRPNASRGCGAIMRAAPVGLWSDDPSAVFRTGCETALLTHGHASAYLPAGALAVIVQQLVSGRTLPEAVERALIELSEWDGNEETATALRRAIELAAEDEASPERLNEQLGQGWVGSEALAIALCAALARPKAFADAVLLAANHSGASDATAAICGNIMGAALAADEIPQRWRSKLELREVITALAGDAALEFGSTPDESEEWLLRYPLEQAEPESTSQADSPTGSDGRVAEREGDESEPTEEPTNSIAETPAPAAEPSDTIAETPAPAAEADGPAQEDDDLSDEEVRLLAVWRKFRDGDDETPSDLSQGLHKLLVEAFGEERAAQLVGESHESTETDGQLAEEKPVRVNRAERFSGCVLGTAIGDALGAPWTFSGLESILQHNPEGVRDFTECFGVRGAATALAQQTVFVLDGLIRAAISARMSGAATNPATAVRHTLQHWMCTQGTCFAPSLPLGELAECAVLRTQRFPDEATLTALAQWGGREDIPTAANPPNSARTATATVRGAAVGLYTDTPASAVSLGAEIAVLTHGHPDGYLPAGALAGMASALQQGQTLAESVSTVLSELDLLEGGERTAQCLRAAVELADHGPVSAADLAALGLGWEAPEALAIGVAAALSFPNDFADAVALAATHSGNSTATAAICGSLLGTARGVQAIPAEWSEEIELREVLERLLADENRIAADVHADQPAPDWAKRYLE